MESGARARRLSGLSSGKAGPAPSVAGHSLFDSSNAALAERYDQVAYAALPHPGTHPDRLATVATFLGMRPPSVAQCRVLEVGCNDGSNLIPMALALPSAQFVGCDLSEQWETVERTISEKIRRRRELIARQEETNEDHAEEINRLQSDVYALRDRLDQLRDSHLDFSALYRILQQGRP